MADQDAPKQALVEYRGQDTIVQLEEFPLYGDGKLHKVVALQPAEGGAARRIAAGSDEAKRLHERFNKELGDMGIDQAGAPKDDPNTTRLQQQLAESKKAQAASDQKVADLQSQLEQLRALVEKKPAAADASTA